MKQRFDFKTKPDYYDKPKPMSKADKVIYLTIAFGLLGLACLIFLNLDSRIA